MSEKYGTIGKSHWRVDGIGKVTGQARFAADISLPGMLWGKTLIAKRPAAKIVSINTEKAAALGGVHQVLTAADLQHAKLFGGVIRNQPVLADTFVRYYGDGVAIVAAETPELAEAALGLIDVVYEDLPGQFDPEAAMAPTAPLVHGGGEPGGDEKNDPPPPETNACVHHRVRKGEVADGFAEAAIVLEQSYQTQFIEHAYLEPEAALAEVSSEGGINLQGSFQNIFSSRKALAAVMGLDLARVTIKQTTLGGSFGGKDEVMTQLGCRAALLAKATGRPVKMVNSRENSLNESYKRHPYAMHYKIGADEAGKLTAIQSEMTADAGPYASMSPFVTWRSAVQATGPYKCDHVSTDTYAAYTNNCYTGAMRGFGAPQINFAIESMMDELATELKIDPLEMRMRNAFEQGSTTATGQCLDSHVVSIREVLQKAAAQTDWKNKRRKLEKLNRDRTDGRRSGIGIACSYRGVSLGAEGMDAVGAIVSVQSDGSVIVTIGLTDMGQGIQSVTALIAAEVLGISPERVQCFNVNTGRVPDSGPTVASRSTTMGGQAVKKAAEAVREVLLEATGGDEGVAFDDAVALAYSTGKPLLGFGWHRSPKTSWDEAAGEGDAYFTFVYGANVAEVEVDMATGKVEVQHVTAVHDVGKAINPDMVRSQIYGGVAMGVGYGVLENYEVVDGIPSCRNFDEYLLVTSMDMPEVTPVIVENADPDGPFGAKAIGEPATELAAPAVVNAIAFATGKRIRSLPADLETVLLGSPLKRTTKRAGQQQSGGQCS
jgi:CO/xanthine dehydrogenase Mo-binding subunit